MRRAGAIVRAAVRLVTPARAALILIPAFGLGFAAPAYANTCAPAATRGTAPSDYQDYCWLDFTGYSDAEVQAGGQPFNFALPDDRY